MLKKIFLGSVVFSASLYTQAGIVNSITGADMAGIAVTATFEDLTTESFIWNPISTTLGNSGNNIIDHEGFSGGVFGSNWSLTQQGFTLGNFDSGNAYGAWSFTDNSVGNAVTKLVVDTNNTGVMFDTETINNLAEDTNGSGQGRSVLGFIGTTEYSGFVASYTNNLQQELYNTLSLDLTAPGTSFQFFADTDKEDAGSAPEVEIDIDEIVDIDNNDFANVVIEEVETEVVAITADVTNQANVAFDNAINSGQTQEQAEAAAQSAAKVQLLASANQAQTAGTPSTVLETITNDQSLLEVFSESPELIEEISSFDITDLPEVGSPEEEEKLEAIIEVVEELLEDEIKEDWDVAGNGEIDVEVDREDGQVSIALEVAEPEDTEMPLNFSTLIDTPLFAFNINFDLGFETETGSLHLSLNDEILAKYQAEDYFNQSTFVSLLVTDERLFGLDDATLKFSLFPGSPAAASLSNINLSTVVPTSVPEPSSILVFLTGLLALVKTRKKS